MDTVITCGELTKIFLAIGLSILIAIVATGPGGKTDTSKNPDEK